MELNFGNNALRGPLPIFSSNLSNLVSIDFSVNLLTGSVPESYGELLFVVDFVCVFYYVD